MKFPVLPIILFAALLVLLTGCESGEFTHYISPQISGRVLAADTHQPLSGVTVARVSAYRYGNSSGPVKGGQLLMQPAGVRTDAGGNFVLDGVSVFAIFRQPGWWTVPVVFNHSGYQSFQTNYTGANVKGHSAEGVPVVSAGEVLLQPLLK